MTTPTFVKYPLVFSLSCVYALNFRFEKLHSTYSQVDVEEINLNGTSITSFTTVPDHTNFSFLNLSKPTKCRSTCKL